MSALALDMPLGSVPSFHLGSIPNLTTATAPTHQDQSDASPSKRLRPDLGQVPGLGGLEDSGMISGDYGQPQRYFDPRNAGDGMPDLAYFAEAGSKHSSSSELEEALQKLTPQDIERRRRILTANKYSFDLGSDGFDSPGSLLGRPGFNFLPYGVRTPESFMSTGSRDFHSGSSNYASGWKLPDKLRIVKPLEGSLTLHQWQRLARPSLEGIFEERRGVAVKGGGRIHTAGTGTGFLLDDKEQLSDLEEDNNEDEADIAMRLKAGASRLQETITNSTRHLSRNEMTGVTNCYAGGSRMSTSLFSSRASSRR